MGDDLVKDSVDVDEKGENRQWLFTYLFIFIVATFAVPVVWFCCGLSLKICSDIPPSYYDKLKMPMPGITRFYLDLLGSLNLINLIASAVIFFMSRFRKRKLGAVAAVLVLVLLIIFNGLGIISALLPLQSVVLEFAKSI